MIQHHIVVNIDKQQFLDPDAFGEGLRLQEFVNESQGTLTALALLFARDNGLGAGDVVIPESCPDRVLVGSWAGDRILIVGDQGTPGRGINRHQLELFACVDGQAVIGPEPMREPNLYGLARVVFDDLSDRLVRFLQEVEGEQSKLSSINFDDRYRSRGEMIEAMREREFDVRQQIERSNARAVILAELRLLTVEKLIHHVHVGD